MESGPERHPGIECQDDIARSSPVASPGRADDETSSDPHHREVRLPGVSPVGLLDQPGPELPDRAQPERLEVAERLRHLGDRSSRDGPVARRHIGPDDGRPSRVQPGAEALIDQLEGRLHGGPAGRRPTEDLADRLDRLDIGFDRKLQPGARVLDVGLAQPSPSFSSRPPPCPTGSPDSSA